MTFKKGDLFYNKQMESYLLVDTIIGEAVYFADATNSKFGIRPYSPPYIAKFMIKVDKKY